MPRSYRPKFSSTVMVFLKVLSPPDTVCRRATLTTTAGQFHTVIKDELPLIRAACARFGEYRPKITIIIVGKRHHTRFYPTEADKADGLGNPAPGTVVDRGVTSVYDFDFYLQAHSGLQGTTRPAHYYVIHDKNNFTSDALQTLVRL